MKPWHNLIRNHFYSKPKIIWNLIVEYAMSCFNVWRKNVGEWMLQIIVWIFFYNKWKNFLVLATSITLVPLMYFLYSYIIVFRSIQKYTSTFLCYCIISYFFVKVLSSQLVVFSRWNRWTSISCIRSQLFSFKFQVQIVIG